MQDKNVTYYFIPANVSAKFEFISGFGWYELKFVLIAALIGLFFFFSLGIFKKNSYYKPEDIPVEMTFGLSEEELIPNEDGYIVITENALSPFARGLFIIFPVAIVFFLVRRDPLTGFSLLSTLIHMRNFSKKQKLYYFKYNSGSEV